MERRELKFRAFYDNKMHDNAEALRILYNNSTEGSLTPKYPIMQYTGLKDKNGKEIYEGDILREPATDDWGKTNYSCFEVFFHDGDANIDYNIGYSINRMHNHGSVCGGYIPSFKPSIVAKMEIIGNIFKNPELLNK